VTVHVGEELRGCVGSFRPMGSLAATVARMAVAAASEDPRFRPIGPEDVAALRIAVSALESPSRLADPRAVEIGKHGLIVKRGWQRGALLPKVAVEHGWGPEEFLRNACLKAGLPPTAWEQPECEVEAFEADEFGEGAEA
jgi:AmmeMemoRadiSam system protein A